MIGRLGPTGRRVLAAIEFLSTSGLDPSVSGLECGHVLRDPIRPHLAIGVGCQDHAVPLASFDKPRLGKIHRRATSVASVRGRRRQSRFNDAEVERQTLAEPSSEARTLISAIVGEYDNADQRWRNRLP